MGGKPSKGTPADMRLKENKQKALKKQAPDATQRVLKKGTMVYGYNK